MRLANLGAILAIVSTPVFAQDDESEEWQAEISLDVSPTLKRAVTEDTVEDSVDLGDFTLSTKIETPEVIAGQRLSLTLGMAYSPIRFDDSDQESNWFVELGVGGTFLEPGAFRGIGRRVKGYQDGIRASASLRHTQAYAGLLDAAKGDAQLLKGAIEYRNILRHFCAVEAARQVRAEGSGCSSGATPNGSFGFAVGANASRTWSDTLTDENISLGASGKLLFPPLKSTLTPGLSVAVDRIVYDAPATLNLPDRRDWRYKLAGELDFAPLIGRADWLSLKLGASQTWLDSNDPTKESNELRGYLELTIAFGYL